MFFPAEIEENVAEPYSFITESTNTEFANCSDVSETRNQSTSLQNFSLGEMPTSEVTEPYSDWKFDPEQRRAFLKTLKTMVPRRRTEGWKKYPKWDGDNLIKAFLSQIQKLLLRLLPDRLPTSGFFKYADGSEHLWKRIMQLREEINPEVEHFVNIFSPNIFKNHRFRSMNLEFQWEFVRIPRMPEMMFLCTEAAFWNPTLDGLCRKFGVECHLAGPHSPLCVQRFEEFRHSLQVVWLKSLKQEPHQEIPFPIDPSIWTLPNTQAASDKQVEGKPRRSILKGSCELLKITKLNSPKPVFRVNRVYWPIARRFNTGEQLQSNPPDVVSGAGNSAANQEKSFQFECAELQ